MKTKMLLALLGLLSLFLFGCIDLMIAKGIDIASESAQKGSDYSEFKKSMTPVPSASGRVFVYTVGTDYLGSAWSDGCTVDNQVYAVMGKTFWFTDLQPGTHKVTVEGVYGFWGGSPTYGKKAVEFDLKEGETKYCRIEMHIGVLTSSITETITMVESAIGESEIANLSFYKNFKTDKLVTVPSGN